MRSNKTDFNNRNKLSWLKWRPTSTQLAILLIAALYNWLTTTAYVAGQFEIRPSVVILNRDGCEHLILSGITPMPQEAAGTCRVEGPYRANFLNAGGRLYLGERIIHITEQRIVSAFPLPDQAWTTRQWLLLGWVILCSLSILGICWIDAIIRSGRNK